MGMPHWQPAHPSIPALSTSLPSPLVCRVLVGQEIDLCLQYLLQWLSPSSGHSLVYLHAFCRHGKPNCLCTFKQSNLAMYGVLQLHGCSFKSATFCNSAFSRYSWFKTGIWWKRNTGPPAGWPSWVIVSLSTNRISLKQFCPPCWGWPHHCSTGHSCPAVGCHPDAALVRTHGAKLGGN